MLKQLSIFDEEVQEIQSYKILEIVKVVNNSCKETDPESYYYLKLFQDKEGKILEVIEKPRLQYRVEFRNGTGYFYHNELMKVE